MKKFFITIALVAVAATSAMAQISAGAGYLNMDLKNGSDVTLNQNGFYAGANVAYGLGSGFAVAPGLYYGYLYSDDSYAGLLETKTNSHYLAIPVNVTYSLPLLDVLDAFVYAGPQFNIGLSSKTEGKLLSVSTEIDNYGDNGTLNRFDVSIGAGLGVEVCDLVRVNFGYNWGLVDLSKSDNTTLKQAGWHVGLSVLF